ncbi:MAG: AAA family ATPase [Planctomycetaceae bacterium]
MRVTEVDIDRYRIWRNLTLPINKKGLSVFYGPNEAGKTTLMRFVRAVLYGYSAEDSAIRSQNGKAAPWRGSIRCRHGKRKFVIERAAQQGTRGALKVTGFKTEGHVDRKLEKLLFNTSEAVFEDIFAIGIKELQQLATMESSEVAERIYGLSLGPEGKALLHAISDVRDSRLELLNGKNNTGQLPNLFGQYENLLANPPALDRSREKHAALCREREHLEERIEELRRRQNVTESNLTGHRHLQRCWQPWNRIRSVQSELNSLPVVNEIRDELFEELRALDSEINRAERKREAAKAAYEQVSKQLERSQKGGDFERHSTALQTLVDQAEWLKGIEDQIARSKSETQALRNQLDRAAKDIGPNWTAERLAEIDTSPTAHARLLNAARAYQAAMNRRGKLRKLNRKLSKSSQAKLVELNEQFEQLGGFTIEEAIANERTRLAQLEDLGHLKLQASELEQRSGTIRTLVNRVDQTATMPEWIDRIFMFFGFPGVILFFVGLLLWATGGMGVGALHGALAGAAFGAAGLTWFFCRLGLINHFENQAGLRLDDLHEEARETEQRLVGIRSQLSGLLQDGGVHGLMRGEQTSAAREVDLIRDCAHRIAELERLGREHDRSNATRDRLRRLRDRFRVAQQGVVETRGEWVSLLRELGMEETVRTTEAFALWGRIQEVNELYTRYRNAAPEAESLTRIYQSMCQRIEEVGRSTGAAKLDFKRPLTVLSGWNQQLKSVERDRAAHQRAIDDHFTKQREADQAAQNVERLRVQRTGLLAKAGASSVEELQQQKEWLELRRDLERQLDQAKDELNEVTNAQPHIALMEDDLVRYDDEQTREAIETAELEWEEVSEELGSAREKLGSIKHEVETLEQSRQNLSARFERGQVAGRIHRSSEEWFALQLAENIIDSMRGDFEKSNVSGTLAVASDYLEQLTQGRYTRIWAPLGKNRIQVDDRLDRTFRIEQLSGGTREQLFLAIRFALVHEFSQRGIELPMVMDDLFVNFDEGRTRAAVDALMSFADSGQQVLFFTCHRHLAGIFEENGVRPIWLPGPAAAEVEDVPEGSFVPAVEDSQPQDEYIYVEDPDNFDDELYEDDEILGEGADDVSRPMVG